MKSPWGTVTGVLRLEGEEKWWGVPFAAALDCLEILLSILWQLQKPRIAIQSTQSVQDWYPDLGISFFLWITRQLFFEKLKLISILSPSSTTGTHILFGVSKPSVFYLGFWTSHRECKHTEVILYFSVEWVHLVNGREIKHMWMCLIWWIVSLIAICPWHRKM